MQPGWSHFAGICFDGSIDPRKFYVQVFIKPLFVPSQHLSFNIGWRLGGGSHTWNADTPNLITELSAGLKREALPFLSRVQSPRDVADAASSLHPIKGPVMQQAITYAVGDPITQQAIAYALARAGDVKEAGDALGRLISLLHEEVPWQHEMADWKQGRVLAVAAP